MNWEAVVAAVIDDSEHVDIGHPLVLDCVEPGVLGLWSAVFWEALKDVRVVAELNAVEKLTKTQRARYTLATTGGDPLKFLQEDSLAHLVLGISPEIFK